MADVTFIVHGEWLDSINTLPAEIQDKVIADIIRYGTEKEMLYTDDPIVYSLVNMVKSKIDYSKDKFEESRKKGTTVGRKKMYSDEIIFKMAKEGKRSEEIAQELGCSKSTIDKSVGWKSRHQEKLF